MTSMTNRLDLALTQNSDGVVSKRLTLVRCTSATVRKTAMRASRPPADDIQATRLGPIVRRERGVLMALENRTSPVAKIRSFLEQRLRGIDLRVNVDADHLTGPAFKRMCLTHARS